MIINDFRVPVGLPDVGHYPELFVALLDSGTWDVEDLKKLAGLNFLRVLTEVEQVNLKLQMAWGVVGKSTETVSQNVLFEEL